MDAEKLRWLVATSNKEQREDLWLRLATLAEQHGCKEEAAVYLNNAIEDPNWRQLR